MTPEAFQAWRVRMYGERGQSAAAAALGCSKTTIAAYERGYVVRVAGVDTSIRIPLYIALACQALSHGLEPR